MARALASLRALGLWTLVVLALPSELEAQVPQFVSATGLFGNPTADLADLDRRIAEQVSRVERLETERARAEAEAQTLTANRAETNRRLRDRARALYRLTRAGALPLTGGFPALLTHLGRRARLERIVRADLEAMSDLRARTAALREQASARAVELEEGRGTLRSLEAEKARLMQAGFYGGAVVATGPTYGLQRSPVIGDQGYGLRFSEPGPSMTDPFESQRGQLMIPLLSPTGMREATREEGEGLEVEGALGASVRAAGDGRVAFASTHAAYGRLVILDHGGSYFTIYGGLGRIDVSVGQSITRGTPLGTLDGSALFFQVRRGTRALPARAWLGI